MELFAGKRFFKSKLAWLRLLIFPFTLLPVFPLHPCHGQDVADKMVATVNGGVQTDLITFSDLMWQLALQPGTPLDHPTSDALNRALRLVEDQKLILQEAKKLPTITLTEKEIQDARDELARKFSSQAELQERMKRVGLTSERYDEIVAERVRIEKYLDFRFRNFIVITQKEIADYYRDVFVPRFKSRYSGRIVPPLEAVRSEIEKDMTESKIESEIDSFLDTARQRAEIVVLNPV